MEYMYSCAEFGIFGQLFKITLKVERIHTYNGRFQFCMRCAIISLQNYKRNYVKDFAKQYQRWQHDS